MAPPPPSPAVIEMYGRLYDSVEEDIVRLGVVLEGAEAKERERVWLRNQLVGDLDDNKIVDGASGERRIYRRRGEPEKKHGAQQRKPKRLVFAVDVSASMARMNNWDGRLDRMCAAVVMLTEALSDPRFSHKFEYAIIGHSGAVHNLPLVEIGNPPTDRDARARVIESMYIHARSASSGDQSLQAAVEATSKVRGGGSEGGEAVADADDYLVFLLSDANLGRYNVSPQSLCAALQSDEEVAGHAIFVAEPSAAEWLAAEMPPGRGFCAMDAAGLVKTLKEAFEAAVLD